MRWVIKRGVILGCGVGVAGPIDITFDISTSLILLVFQLAAVVETGLTALDTSSNRISFEFVWLQFSGLAVDQSIHIHLGRLRTGWHNYCLHCALATLNVSKLYTGATVDVRYVGRLVLSALVETN